MQIDLFNQPDNTTLEHRGSDYDSKLDKERLSTQYDKIYNLMRDGEYRTLNDIEIATGILAQASISAQLRFMRKNGHTVLKRRKGEQKGGLFEYKLIEKPNPSQLCQ